MVLLIFVALGSAATRSERAGGIELLAGWGLVASFAVALQWVVALDLRWYAVFLLVAAFAAIVMQRRELQRNALWRPALLLLPALVVACGVPLDEWDSFSHWGINAAWLWRFDALPSPDLPISPSSNPDYPYGYPLALYLASLVRGVYIENAGAIFNILVLVGVASGLSLLAAGDDRHRLAAYPWYWSAWGVLAVMALNPGFVRGTTLATYADTAFAAALFFLCLCAWNQTLDERGRGRGALATMSVAMALVMVKEGGLVLLGVVAIAVALSFVRYAPARTRLGRVLTGLAPAFAVGMAWQAWVAEWLPSSFTLLPWSDWRFVLLPELLSAAGGEVLDHLPYYVLLTAVVALGLRGAWRCENRTDLFHMLAGLVVLGHFATMLLAYLGASFTEAEVMRAASFHRYATQLAPLSLGSLLLAVGERLRSKNFAPRRPNLVVGACVMVMVIGAPYLHRERTPTENFYLESGRDMAARLPEDSHIGIIGWREEPYGYFLLRYALFRPGLDDRGIRLERLFRPLAPPGQERRAQLRRLARHERLSHLLIIEGGNLHTEQRVDMLLLARRASGWRRIEGWQRP